MVSICFEEAGLEFIHETFTNRSRVERFYNNINTKSIASIQDFGSAIAIVRNLFIGIGLSRSVILSWQDRGYDKKHSLTIALNTSKHF